MKKRLPEIRPLILSSPIDTWTNEECSALFQRVVGLKLAGYGANYPAGVLPIDTTDFYAAHLVIGHDEGAGGFRPLMSGKTTTLSRTEFHRHTFPALSLVQQASARPHIDVVERELARARFQKKEVGYFGSWTVAPEVRRDEALKAYLRDVFPGLYVHFHRFLKVDEIFLGGTLRFKTELLFQRLGHEALRDGDVELPQINVRHLFGEPVQVMHLKAFSEEALREAERTKKLWETCEVIGPVARPAAA